MKLKIKEKYTNFSQNEMDRLKDIINNISNQRIYEETIVTNIKQNVLNNSKKCFDNNKVNCFDDISKVYQEYIDGDMYNIPNLSAREINTKKLCFGNNCIDQTTINGFKDNILFDRLKHY